MCNTKCLQTGKKKNKKEKGLIDLFLRIPDSKLQQSAKRKQIFAEALQVQINVFRWDIFANNIERTVTHGGLKDVEDSKSNNKQVHASVAHL